MDIALINKIKILILNELNRRNIILKNNINSSINVLNKRIQVETDRAIAAEQDIKSKLLFDIELNENTGYLYIIYGDETPDEGDIPL